MIFSAFIKSPFWTLWFVSMELSLRSIGTDAEVPWRDTGVV